MADTQPVLPRCSSHRNHIRIWIKVFVFKMMFGFISEMSSMNDGQYIYHFVKEQLLKNSVQNNATSLATNMTINNGNCQTGNTSSTSVEGRVQSETTTINQYSEMTSSGISVFVLILLGPLTDKVGRKPLLIWNVTMLLIGMTIRTAVVFNSLNVYLVLITSAFTGLSGTHYAYDLASSGIMADTTTKNKQRSFVMILYNSAGSIGFLIAQIATGYLIHYFGYISQYIICAVILLILDISIIVLLKEEKRKTFDKCGTICSISKKSQIWSLVTDKEIGDRKHIFSWLLVFTFFMFAVTAYVPLQNLYQLGSPFCWDSERIGWYGASLSLVQGLIGPLVIALLQLCLPDEIILQFGYLSTIVCFAIYGIASHTWMLYTIVGIGVIRYSPMTLIKAILSRKVHPDKQGVLFSNMALVDSVVRVAGVAAFSGIYKQTRPILKGMVFLFMGGLSLVSALMAIFCTNIYGIDPHQRERKDSSVSDQEIHEEEKENTNNDKINIQYSFE